MSLKYAIIVCGGIYLNRNYTNKKEKDVNIELKYTNLINKWRK